MRKSRTEQARKWESAGPCLPKEARACAPAFLVGRKTISNHSDIRCPMCIELAPNGAGKGLVYGPHICVRRKTASTLLYADQFPALVVSI